MAYVSVFDFENGDSANIRIVKEKISSLKSAFMSKHFNEVKEFLVSMVEKLELEMKSLKKEKKLVEETVKIQRFEKMKVESELRECRRECLQLKKERDGFNEILKSISEDKRIMKELKEENCALKGEKLKAETEIDFYKRKFEDLETRFLLLKKDVMLKSKGPSGNVGAPGEVVGEKGAVDENVESGEIAINVSAKMNATDCNDLVIEARGVSSCHPLKSGYGDVGTSGFCRAGVSGEGLVEKGVSEKEMGSEGIGNLKSKMGVIDTVSGAIGGSCCNSLQSGDGNVGAGASGGGTPQLTEIIETGDTDDDSPLCAVLSIKELAMKGCEDEAGLDQELVENQKRASSNLKDGDAGSNEHKVAKWMIEGHNSLPVNHCSTTAMSSGSKLEEKMTAENQRNKLVWEWDGLLLDSDSEESSSSSDDLEDWDLSVDFSAMSKFFARK